MPELFSLTLKNHGHLIKKSCNYIASVLTDANVVNLSKCLRSKYYRGDFQVCHLNAFINE